MTGFLSESRTGSNHQALSLKPDDSNPFRPDSPSQSPDKSEDRRETPVPKQIAGTAGALPSMTSLSRVDPLRIIVARVLLILVTSEEFGQRARFTLLLP